jgi:hypothetical protein
MPAYLDYLAAGVPPRRLIASVARKAWRTARVTLWPGPVAPGREEILRGMRVGTPGALAERLAGPPDEDADEGGGSAARIALGRGLVAHDRAGITAGLARFFPEQAARSVERAEKAAAGRLAIFGRELDVRRPGGGTDWQLDPVHGRRFAGWAPSHQLPELPGADIKATWALGRGDQWVALGCGALADPARADRFAEAYVASVRDFVAQNPVGHGAQWACPMEAALRAVCLGQAHALLAGRPAVAEGGYAIEVVRLAVATGRFVAARLEDLQAVPNNHLAADFVGLLACAALVPEWPEAARWRALGKAGLVRQLAAQTHEDGTTFEGSVPYHRLAVEIFTAGALLARRARAPLSGEFWRRLAAMYAASRALLASTGELPQIGDDDSGRVLTFVERAALDGAYLLPLGAAMTGDPALRARPGAQDAEEVLWLCGPSSVERLCRAPPGPAPLSASFPRGGFHVLRRGGIEVALSCGRNGQAGIGGHSHNDKLAFELRLGGRLAICDPGSPSYTADPQLRDSFRSTRAHATLMVDGEEQAPIPPGRPFALPDGARATCLVLESAPRWERFVGEHHGYAHMGLVHRREVLLLDGALVVIDRLRGGGAHGVELRFPFPFPFPDARLRPMRPHEVERLTALGAGAAALLDVRQDVRQDDVRLVVEIGPLAAPLALLAVAGPAPLEARLEGAMYSPGYAQLVPASTAAFAGRLTCPATLWTVILPLSATGYRLRATARRQARHPQEAEDP